MKLTELNPRPGIEEDAKLHRVFAQFEKLISELDKRELPENIVTTINQYINDINALPLGKGLRVLIRNHQTRTIQLVAKELKIVPKKYYQNIWLAIGMSVFGVPFGVVFGMALDNMAFIGIGLPIGMVIGLALGAKMDKKAEAEDRQLDLEIRN